MKNLKVDMTKNVYVAGNPSLEAALKKFNDDMKNGEADVVPVFDLIVEQLKDDIEVICPVIFPEGLPQLEEGEFSEDGTCEKETTMQFQRLDGENGELWLVAFTSGGESDKAPESSSIPIMLKDLFEMTLQEECTGLIINPFGDSISITKQGIQSILNALLPPTQDQLDLQAGADAYNKGDYKTAIELYTKAAAAGNVTALSNLGYCYYYGRSIPVDKAKAHECWEKAAILGDVCATYKIGDMYRNGDLPKDEVFAKQIYIKAFYDSMNFMDIYNYPDAFLRILKYCPDNFDEATLSDIALKCRDGFRARMDDGDNYTMKLLKEADNLCDKYVIIAD